MRNHWLYKNILKVLGEELLDLYRGRSYESCDALVYDRYCLIQQLPSLERAKNMGIDQIKTEFVIRYDPPSYWVESLTITVESKS